MAPPPLPASLGALLTTPPPAPPIGLPQPRLLHLQPHLIMEIERPVSAPPTTGTDTRPVSTEDREFISAVLRDGLQL